VKPKTAASIDVQTLAQFSAQQPWRLPLAQSRAHHTLVWITRGQGRVLLDGTRRGVSAHHALWIPADHLFSIELGTQVQALVVTLPKDTDLRLPQMAQQLRLRDVYAQTELTGLIDSTSREVQDTRPLRHDALDAHAGLLSVWLRRQSAEDAQIPNAKTAAAVLSAQFCDAVSQRFAQGQPIAAYAAALGVTPTHLSRTVKSATGRTAAELLHERVLFEALSLLSETSASVQSIAVHLGFGSAAYFSRFVQKHTGKTPRDFKG